MTLVPDDILRARLETLGVEEHRLIMETGKFIDSLLQLEGPTCAEQLLRPVSIGYSLMSAELAVNEVRLWRGDVGNR